MKERTKLSPLCNLAYSGALGRSVESRISTGFEHEIQEMVVSRQRRVKERLGTQRTNNSSDIRVRLDVFLE
jgi:hypothetical protein